LTTPAGARFLTWREPIVATRVGSQRKIGEASPYPHVRPIGASNPLELNVIAAGMHRRPNAVGLSPRTASERTRRRCFQESV
jgi:hypothetical protein